MKAADHIIDLGPNAGEHGGQIVFEGDYAHLIAPKNQSLTGRYLRGELKVSHRKHRHRITPKGSIKFFGARMHNLKGIDVSVPLGLLTVVTGTFPAPANRRSFAWRHLHRPLQSKSTEPTEDSPKTTCTRVEGASRINDVVMIDQTPIGPHAPLEPGHVHQSLRHNPNDLRQHARCREAEATPPVTFRSTSLGGRCETCQGDGTVTVEMQFLADEELICEDCNGTRFKSAILDIKYKGLNFHEVLRPRWAKQSNSSTTHRD